MTASIDHPMRRVAVQPGVDHHPFLRDPERCLAIIESILCNELQ